MAVKVRPWMVLYLFILCFISSVPKSSSQSNSPQNIEVFYPFGLPPIAPSPNSTNNQPISPPLPPTNPPQPPPPSSPLSPSKSSSKKAVVKAVAATAASTLVISGLFFFLLQRHTRRRREKDSGNSKDGNPVVPLPRHEFVRFNGNLKGVVLDEEGLDVLYWRKLEAGSTKNGFNKEGFNHTKEEKEDDKKVISKGDKRRKTKPPIQEIPLLRGKSSTSQNQVWSEVEIVNRMKAPTAIPVGVSVKAVEKQDSIQQSTRSPPPPKPVLAVAKLPSPAPPPPPPSPPLFPAKKSPAPPPPPLKTGGLASSSSSKPPPPPKGMPSNTKQGQSSSGGDTTGSGNGQVKLKPLHWDKVNPNVDHSMVWHKIDDGSFRFDGDLMEALFGSVATNKKSPRRDSSSSSPINKRSGPPSQIFILDTRKSQNTAIVLRSLAISREEVINALIEGQGLNADTLEKLAKIAPTEEEESQILAFDGDPTRLADAESFLYHLLKAVPTAFTRFNAMLFRSNYAVEILHVKESCQTLELGCKEFRTRGLFLKLLEAILKAGNRMNAGTSRGNAQAFNLTALRKLSDVKSTDGKTTLLHFVVEEVVRSEGKRCVINRSHSLSRSTSLISNSGSLISNSGSLNSIPTSKDEREKEYIKLGLPVVGGISAEFSNVKKAATLDYDAFAKSCSGLTDHVNEIRQIVTQCATSGGGFVREIKGFLDAAEEEIKVVREEQTRVMELVKRTTEYYQAGASKDKGENLFQLFVVVKDFLGMVDHVCVEIARNLQKRKTSTASSAGTGTSTPKSPASRSSVKFPQLPANFMSDKSKSSSSDSDDDF